MPIYQAYNKKINAWVKYEFSKTSFKIIDIKQRLPDKPFKNILKRGNLK